MPPLRNAKHELMAHNLSKHNFNGTKAYKQTYPDNKARPDTSASRLLNSKPDITERAKEILSSYGRLRLGTLLKSFTEDLEAKKPILVNGEVEMVRDNFTILNAKKYLVGDVYGVGSKVEVGQIVDNRQLNITMTSPQDIDRLNEIIGKLERLETRQTADEAIQSGEIE